jgi:hypothetical protein
MPQRRFESEWGREILGQRLRLEITEPVMRQTATLAVLIACGLAVAAPAAGAAAECSCDPG